MFLGLHKPLIYYQKTIGGIMEKQKIKIDCNLLNGSIEIVLLNRLHKDNLIDKKTYKQEQILKKTPQDKILGCSTIRKVMNLTKQVFPV